MADGGEGTFEIVKNATPGSQVVDVGLVTGPDGSPTPSHYLALDDETALVELAVCSGITLMDPLNAMTATTTGTW
jgi:glycerate 2-kinase